LIEALRERSLFLAALSITIVDSQPGQRKDRTMRNSIVVEDIQGMRLREGIDDAELREEIRGLATGDFVKLTLLSRAGPYAGETLLVRITRIRGSLFCGVLAENPTCRGLSKLRAGSPVRFTTAHIHSVSRKQAKHEH
jgi:hypothetical protein